MCDLRFEKCKSQRGNALFLILIAVALFAALSYAVTQSTRSGVGQDRETDLAESAALVQYPVSIKTAVMRMVIGGIEESNLEFNSPSELSSCTSSSVCVFHPDGLGGATYQIPHPDQTVALVDTYNLGFGGFWTFSGHYEVENIASSVASSFAGNEITAFLVGIEQSMCETINERLGITAMPVFDSAQMGESLLDIPSFYMDESYSPPASEHIIGPSNPNSQANTHLLSGRIHGCYFEEDIETYVYYHVLVER